MHVSRDCVTSVRSYSDPPIQLGERAVSSSRVLLAFTLRGLPELAARGFLVYFENRGFLVYFENRGFLVYFENRGRTRSRSQAESPISRSSLAVTSCRHYLRGGAAGARPQRPVGAEGTVRD